MLINGYSVGSVFVFYVFVSFVYFNMLTIFSNIFVELFLLLEKTFSMF